MNGQCDGSLPSMCQWKVQDKSVRERESEQFLLFGNLGPLVVKHQPVSDKPQFVTYNSYDNYTDGKSKRYHDVSPWLPLLPSNHSCEKNTVVDYLSSLCARHDAVVKKTKDVRHNLRSHHQTKYLRQLYKELKAGTMPESCVAMPRMFKDLCKLVRDPQIHRGKCLDWLYNGGCLQYSSHQQLLYFVRGEKLSQVCIGKLCRRNKQGQLVMNDSCHVINVGDPVLQVDVRSFSGGLEDIVAIRTENACHVYKVTGEGDEQLVTHSYSIQLSATDTTCGSRPMPVMSNKSIIHVALSPHIVEESAAVTENSEIIIREPGHHTDSHSIKLDHPLFNSWAQVHFTNHPKHLLYANHSKVSLIDLRGGGSGDCQKNVFQVKLAGNAKDVEIVACVRCGLTEPYTFVVTENVCYLVDDRFAGCDSSPPLHAWNISGAECMPHQMCLYRPQQRQHKTVDDSHSHQLLLFANQFSKRTLALQLNNPITELPVCTYPAYNMNMEYERCFKSSSASSSQRLHHSLLTGVCMISVGDGGGEDTMPDSTLLMSTSLGDVIYQQYSFTARQSLDETLPDYTEQNMQHWRQLCSNWVRPHGARRHKSPAARSDSSVMQDVVDSFTHLDIDTRTPELSELLRDYCSASVEEYELCHFLPCAATSEMVGSSSGGGDDGSEHHYMNYMPECIDTSESALSNYCKLSGKIVRIWNDEASIFCDDDDPEYVDSE